MTKTVTQVARTPSFATFTVMLSTVRADLLTGLEAIDAAHADILATVDDFHRHFAHATPEERVATAVPALRALFARLIDLCVTHFREEEDTMRRAHYPDTWKHHDAHLAMWHACLIIVESCEDDGYSIQCGDRVAQFIRDWLTAHVPAFDRPFATFLKTREAGRGEP
jgi:hemerythrin-like metal-binding protein